MLIRNGQNLLQMLRAKYKSAIALISVCLLCTCIDPYNPKLGSYSTLLVVDGLITDSNKSNVIKLSKTYQDQNTDPLMITNATVYITDNIGNSNYLKNGGNGIYKTDSLEFKGVSGRTYVLHIQADGSDYESEPCLMEGVPEIDRIYFEKDEELVNNGTQTQQGIKIYLDSKNSDNNQFFRWEFDETWKFKIPFPKKFNFNIADSSVTVVPDVKEFCWKSRKSDEILINSINSGQSHTVKKEPLFFIASDQSDRLLIQYSILVKQYSISEKEYNFWNNLKQLNEIGGDIFSRQPFIVTSNIRNVNNPGERVMGYFQVSAVTQKRKNITKNDLVNFHLPPFRNTCVELVKEPKDYPNGFGQPPTTWAQLYTIFCGSSKYYFVEPLYGIGIPGKMNLAKMVFAKPECVNCELSGTSKKPDFWVDLN
jgi:hypothetical protein